MTCAIAFLVQRFSFFKYSSTSLIANSISCCCSAVFLFWCSVLHETTRTLRFSKRLASNAGRPKNTHRNVSISPKNVSSSSALAKGSGAIQILNQIQQVFQTLLTLIYAGELCSPLHHFSRVCSLFNKLHFNLFPSCYITE